MATGIVSIGAQRLDVVVLPVVLLVVDVGAYLVLWLLTLLRLLHHRRLFVNDLFSHQRGLGFFTLVAGACVLGVQMILIAHSYAIATGWRYGFRRLPLTYDPLYWPRPSA